jgi:hypothetical protein
MRASLTGSISVAQKASSERGDELPGGREAAESMTTRKATLDERGMNDVVEEIGDTVRCPITQNGNPL